MVTLKSLIVGPGAIGALACAHAQNFSNIVVHQHRPNIYLARSLFIDQKQIPLDWTLNNEDSPAPDLIWVCCKANAVVDSVRPLLIRYPEAIAILLHNGMGPQQSLVAEFGERVIVGSTTCGALFTAPDTFTQTSFGQTYLSFSLKSNIQLKMQKSLMANDNNSGPLNIHQTKNIEQMLWQKLLVNACINPISAFYDIQNGAIREAKYRQDIQSICDEVNQIIQALALPPINNPVELVMDVARISCNNWSSMAMDVKANRSTEIDYINGYLMECGRKLSIPTPSLEKWYKRIAFKLES